MCLYLDNNITYLVAQMNDPIIANGCYATVYAIRRACRRYVVRYTCILRLLRDTFLCNMPHYT